MVLFKGAAQIDHTLTVVKLGRYLSNKLVGQDYMACSVDVHHKSVGNA